MAEQYMCATPITTLWTSLEKVRKVDQHAIKEEASLYDWLQQMTTQERRALCFERRVETQVLYGELIEIDEQQGDWVKVRAIEQSYRDTTTGYPGWMPALHLVPYKAIEALGYVRVQQLKTPLLDVTSLAQLLVLSLNTTLPVVTETATFYEVATPHGTGYVWKNAVQFAQNKQDFYKGTAEQVAAFMMQMVDTPYLWGGMSSYGYDCSGLAHNAMKACGYMIPRDASDQAKVGRAISTKNKDEWRIGDLVFFTTPPAQTVTHVGIYLGQDLLLHATIYKDKVEVIRLQGHSLNNEISHVRRYIEEDTTA